MRGPGREFRAIQYLKCNSLLYADMLMNFARGTGKVVQENEHGVLMKVPGTLMLGADSQDAAEQLMQSLPERSEQIEVHGGGCMNAAKKFGMAVFVTCRQAAWLQTKPLAALQDD